MPIAVDDVTGAQVFSGVMALAGPALVSVTTSSDLATLLGVALNTGVKRLLLIPSAAGIYWAVGTASAGTSVLPAGGISIPVTKIYADTLRFYAAGATGLSVTQFG
jgi:hypothetical protein